MVSFARGPFKGWSEERVRDFLVRQAERTGSPEQNSRDAYLEILQGKGLADRISATFSLNSKFTGHTVLDMDDPYSWAQKEYLNYVEKKYLAGEHCYTIVLKSRRLGFTSLHVALSDVLTQTLPRFDIVHIMDKDENAQTAIDMLAYSNYHQRFGNQGRRVGDAIIWNDPEARKKRNRKSDSAWDIPHFSSYRIYSARSQGAGRGKGFNALILDERAHYPPGKDALIAAIIATCQGEGFRLIAQISTANGAGGQFYNLWRNSCRGLNEYQRFFFPWHLHPGYRKPVPVESEYRYRGKNLTDLERDMVESCNLDIQQLAWHRHTCHTEYEGNEAIMCQEFPHTEDVAWLASGTPVLPAKTLLTVRKRLESIKPVFRGDIIEDEASWATREPAVETATASTDS